MIDFTEDQLERYSRHIFLEGVGIAGQEKIRQSKVLVIGAGGLGSPVALYLAAAGVGTLTIADGDKVHVSNLQRQIIHATSDIGRAKTRSAREKIGALNPEVTVNVIEMHVVANTIRPIVRGHDFVVDCTDNFTAKFLINDACVLEKVPYSHGGIQSFTGQTMTIVPGLSACYRCVFSGPPPRDIVPTCLQTGVLGAVAGMLGTIQATEALKSITGVGQLLTNSLLIFDAATMDFRKVALNQRGDCAVCGTVPTIAGLAV